MGQELVCVGLAFKHRLSSEYEESENVELGDEIGQEDRHCSDNVTKASSEGCRVPGSEESWRWSSIWISKKKRLPEELETKQKSVV